MRFSLKNDHVSFTLGNTPYNRPQQEKNIFNFDDMQDEEADLPGEKTDIGIELSEVTEILPSSCDNENQNELLNQVYRVGSRRDLSYSSLLTVIKTTMKNNVLHIAARNGNDKIVSLVVERAPKLLFEFNENNESALHIAARGGHISIMEMLLAAYANFVRRDIKTAWLEYTNSLDGPKDYDEESNMKVLLEEYDEKSNMEDLLKFVKKKNVEGNTMFHEAMLCGDKKRIWGDKIFKVCEHYITGDSSSKWCYELALVNVNNAKQSVLYLAVYSEDKKAVKVILENYPNNVAKPEGISPVVAAILRQNQEMLKDILQKKPSWIHLIDKNKRLPLHHAAYIGYLEGVDLLLGKCKCCIIQRDRYGNFPVHLASYGGHVEVVNKLLEYCPDPTEMLDIYKRNILHVAAKSGKHELVKHILQQSRRIPYLDGMINQKDNIGDTPLHLAAKSCHPKTVFYLTWDERVDLRLVNQNNQTALEVTNAISQLRKSSSREQLTRIALTSAGVKPSFTRLLRQSDSNLQQFEQSNAEPSDTKQQKVESDSKSNENKETVNNNTEPRYFFLKDSDQQYRDRVETLTLVSTLIITASVAACFAVPGEAQGKAYNLCHAMFQAFIIFITISLFSSISSTIILVWAKLGLTELAACSLKIVSPLLGTALISLSLAFMTGLYTVISQLTWLANLLMVATPFFILVVFLSYIVLFLPSSSTRKSMRYMSYYPFLFLAWLTE